MKKKSLLFVFAFSTMIVLQTSAQLVATMDDLPLGIASYWNGSNGSGGFTSGSMTFKNQYNADYFSWSGFAYSNVTDNTTSGYGNQYSAIAGKGALESANYAVGYNYGADTMILSKPSDMFGMYITNSTYSALAMQEGDLYSKKFGGTSGSDEDWFKLAIKGWNGEKKEVGTIEYYLADYRFSDNSQDYIIKDWQWIDMSSLLNVSFLTFELSSTDNGDWGMNTPAYFCIDQVTIKNFTGINEPIFNASNTSAVLFDVFPNPAQSYITISGRSNINRISIINLAGQVVYLQEGIIAYALKVNLENINKGIYIVKVETDNQTEIHKISKQ